MAMENFAANARFSGTNIETYVHYFVVGKNLHDTGPTKISGFCRLTTIGGFRDK